MFYNHDILTSKKHGVATIWLVATLGSRSTLKKVTRKAILDVKIAEACKTIVAPEAPMALRLQGSLLYGVSRVFSQQCGYILTDVQSLHEKMRTSSIVINNLQVDHNVGATKVDQLNLQDDPNFDMELDFCLDLSAFGVCGEEERELSMRSPRESSANGRSGSAGQLEDFGPEISAIDTPDHGFEDFGLPLGMVTSSIARSAPSVQLGDHVNEPAIYDNSDFRINDDGELMIPGEEESGLSIPHLDIRSSIDRFQPVRTNTRATDDEMRIPALGEDYDMDMLVPTVDEPHAGEAADITVGTPPDPLINTPPDLHRSVHDFIATGEDMEAATEAQHQRRERAVILPIPDHPAEISNRELTAWGTNYLETMLAADQERSRRHALVEAKRNALFWLMEHGIGGSIEVSDHPFTMFSGQALLESLGCEPFISSKKRHHSPVDEVDEFEQRRVRSRSGDHDMARNDGLPHIVDEDGYLAPQDNYPESEVGRRDESSLKDRSSQMPWNLSSRHGSVRYAGSGLPARSSSIGGMFTNEVGPPSAMGRSVSRLTSASPLIGKSRGVSQAGRNEPEDDTMLENFSLDEFGDLDVQLAGNIHDNFQLHDQGPLASLQTVARNRWTAATLEREAYNFLEFLQSHIQEAIQQQDDISDDQEAASSTTFAELLPSEETPKAVAAQALLHVLSLTTKGLTRVIQTDAYGEISLSVVEVVASSPVVATAEV